MAGDELASLKDDLRDHEQRELARSAEQMAHALCSLGLRP